jgi:hypothetical protein
VGPNDHSWLFRQGELILGPVPAAKIVEKIYSHELDAKSEVQAMGSGRFQRLAEVDGFKVHLAKADAKKRVDHVAKTTEASANKRRNTAIGITAGVLLAIGVGVVVVGNYLAVHTPGKSSEEMAYGDLISVEAPTISRAKRSGNDEELVDYPGLGGPKKPIAVAQKDKPDRPDRPDRPAGTTNKPKLNNETAEDSDGLQMAKFDQGTINTVVKSHQRSLFPCLAQINKPGQMQKIPIEFVIGNNGRVSKVWVDHPDYKSGTLPECLLKELQKWPFKNYDGEQATVSLSFNIGKAT